jgi:predicted DNA-binding antitoxin AbrB/MazE fold protein
VYKDGALHPLEPLALAEMQEESVTVTDSASIDDDLAGYFTAEEWLAAAHDPISREDVRRAFSGISGSLSEAVIAQRHER